MADTVNRHTRLTPRIVNTFFILALQNYFIHHDEYTFSPNDYDTKIDVTTGYSEDGKTATTMPIVTIENGGSNIIPSGVATGTNTALYRDYTGIGEGVPNYINSKHDFLVNSTTEISIFTFTKDAADELAFEIAMFIMMLKYNVGNVIQIQNIDSCSISPARQIDISGWASKWVANVVFPYTFSVSRLYQPVDTGILLRSIDATLNKQDSSTGEVENLQEAFIHSLNTGETKHYIERITKNDG